ncbi:four helix bundle protein [Syntrophotalea acetylenivorans]|uniref:Four helix bundle protein n=1 Tax=Syntrophotalea acetylenivorans TaxID=1842532 RepID=A0A1L3GKL0_9BACT|nr:four helix bundle protein [Syntrophotalea acetylenivorans]APG26462.1 four helix bundle protein [Syntrophotalea acetylenivorans]
MASKISHHKDLDVWQLSMALVSEIYRLTGNFPKEEIYGLTNQMRRAAVSVPSNIAEGAARNSKKEFLQYLYVSLGSLAELETQLLISKNLGYLASPDSTMCELENIRKMLSGLVNYVRSKLGQ